MTAVVLCTQAPLLVFFAAFWAAGTPCEDTSSVSSAQCFVHTSVTLTSCTLLALHYDA